GGAERRAAERTRDREGRRRMTIRDDARQEAERRWPSYPAVGFSGASDRQQAFIDGAIWASEQAEAIDRMGPAAGCAYCVGAGGYEDYDGEWRECSCQRAGRELSDAEVEAAANAIVEASFGQELPEAPIDLAR